MAPMPGTPRRSGAGRPRKSTTRSDFIDSTTIDETTVAEDTEQPRKKLRYIPGGPGGGGRYVDTADGSEILVGGTGPGGYNYVGPRGRIGRENAAAGLTPVTYPRGDRSTRTRTVAPRSRPPRPTFTSAAHAAATMSQNDGYKPREERGWEEFHPTLDIDGRLVTFTAAEVDGIPQTRPVTPGSAQATGGSLNGTQTPNGDIFGDPEDQTSPDHLQQDLSKITSIPGTPPTKRRPGRPPRDPAAFYAARAAAPAGGTPHTPRIAPLQNQHAKEKLTLPQPSYRKVDFIARFEDKASGLMRYVDKSMANIGYQETDIFQRPEDRLMKASDSTFDDDMDPENVGRVEYDMDEQDDYWLRDYNERRKAMDIEAITRELFEFTVTLIEKKWHALEKRIPKPNPKPPQTHRPRSSSAAAVNGEPGAGEEQDSKCAICDDGDCENTNAIVFCDGCDLAVHQECYGVPFIPEGQWLCRKCQLIGRGIPTCIFCPNTDGAFKQTNASKWAHLLCAMWIPEVSLGNHTFMEPVMDVEKVPKNRWKLNCYICNQKMGACIQCGNKQCFQAFHVTCARRGRLFLKMKNSQGQIVELDGQTVLKAFCDKHCPAEYARDNDVVQATREAKRFYKRTMRGRIWANSQSVAQAVAATHRNAVAEHPPDESQATGARLSLTLGDPKKKGTTPSKAVWKLPSGAPIIPAIVYDAVDALLQRFTIRKRKDYIAEVCRYWTLKREFRRGAPLIKRLQLQNETFSSMELTRRNFAGMGEVGRRRLERRIDFAEKLVNDLEKLKELADQTMERGKLEQEAIAVWAETINTVYFPVWKLLPPILDRAITLDIKNVFRAGFYILRIKLMHRFYTRATTLAQDFACVLSAGILEGPLGTDAVDVQVSPSKQAANDIRERRKLGKRITKAIQPQLEYALHAEADIDKVPAEKLVNDVHALLERCLFDRQSPASHNLDELNLGISQSIEWHPTETAQAPVIELPENDAPGKGVNDQEPSSGLPTSGKGVTNATNVGDVEMEDVDQIKSTHVGSAITSSHTPPDSNGYQAAPEHRQPPPPTPPLSNGSAIGAVDLESDARDFLTDGGKPWYLKSQFEIDGTNVKELQWTGRDIVRSMSEELTDIDDEELKDMGEEMEGIQLAAAEPVLEEKTLEVPKSAKKPKARKRWRGFR